MPDQTTQVPLDGIAAPPPGDRFAASLRGFGPVGIVAILLILSGNAIVTPLSAIMVLVWVRWSRTPWRSFFGVWCQQTIGRINIFDDAGAFPEAIDNIQMWI